MGKADRMQAVPEILHVPTISNINIDYDRFIVKSHLEHGMEQPQSNSMSLERFLHIKIQQAQRFSFHELFFAILRSKSEKYQLITMKIA